MAGGQFQNDDRDRVKAASDIVEVLREHLTLTPKGREYLALCPFHDDHKPSMYVVPAKQMFHCFSCGASGDVLTFMMRYLGLEFPEALRTLAERAGIELTPRGLPVVRRDDEGVPLEQIREALGLASDFYRVVLHKSDAGRPSREMIRSRGISDAMVERFALGAAPDEWERLGKALRAKGVSDTAMIAAGLARQRDSGGCFDMIRNRLVFPIQAAHGKPVAFGARKLNPDDEPKYLNTPESPVFKKGRLLYGLSQAMASIIKTGRVIVVEGYIDVIACHQYGFTNVVGTMGTALTREHARLLRGRATQVVLLFDSDEAGQRAAHRAGDVFFTESLDVRVAVPPASGDSDDTPKDPDELLAQEGGPEVFAHMIESSRDVIELRVAALRERAAGAGPSAMAAAVEQELARLAEIGIHEIPPLRRRLILRQIAGVVGLTAHEVERLLPRGRNQGRRDEPTDAPSAVEPDAYRPTDPLPVRELLLGCALCCPRLVRRDDRDMFRPDAYSHPLLAKVAQGVTDVLARGSEPGLEAVLRALGQDEPARQTAHAIAHHVEHIHRTPASARAGHTDADLESRLEASWNEAVRRVRREQTTPLESLIESKFAKPDAAALLAAMRQSVARKRALGTDPGALPRPYET